ncbi:MAG: hypothetical protein KIT56_02000 [Gammaproteobacteria bacterium]|nr:hypothetical protein [Gammaproteobacteria bacterium]MCW5582657.1 hypothetical protein [Gammaproteobacteria bacterium]
MSRLSVSILYWLIHSLGFSLMASGMAFAQPTDSADSTHRASVTAAKASQVLIPITETDTSQCVEYPSGGGYERVAYVCLGVSPPCDSFNAHNLVFSYHSTTCPTNMVLAEVSLSHFTRGGTGTDASFFAIVMRYKCCPQHTTYRWAHLCPPTGPQPAGCIPACSPPSIVNNCVETSP